MQITTFWLSVVLTILHSVAINSIAWTQEAVSSPAEGSEHPHIVETENELKVIAGERSVLVYRKTPPPLPEGVDPVYRRSGFIHPVTTPSGAVLTASYPADHLHQDGIFSAWAKTTYDGHKVDFWNLFGATGRVRHERVVSTNDDGSVSFTVQLIHEAMVPERVDVLRETWIVSLIEASHEYNCFDVDLKQVAMTDVPLQIEKYHYGGFAVRGSDAWLIHEKESGNESQPNVKMLNSNGSNRVDGNHQQANWVSLSGPTENGTGTIVVMSRSSNFRAPQPTRLHPTMPYFCFAPCVEQPFIIDRQHDYHALYRIYTFDHEPDADWLMEKWQTWNMN